MGNNGPGSGDVKLWKWIYCRRRPESGRDVRTGKGQLGEILTLTSKK